MKLCEKKRHGTLQERQRIQNFHFGRNRLRHHSLYCSITMLIDDVIMKLEWFPVEIDIVGGCCIDWFAVTMICSV